MEKKSNKGIIIALCTVIVVLIGAITYMFINGTISFNVKENKDNETEEKEDNSPKQLSLDEPLVQKLYGYVTVETGYGEVRDFFGKYGTITNETVTNEMKLSIALSIGKLGSQFNFVKTEQAQWGETKLYNLDSNIITSKINEIFGKDNGYQHNIETLGVSFDFVGAPNGLTSGCASISYNEATSMYEMIVSGGCGGMTDHIIYSKLVNAEKINDTIVLTQKGYVSYSGNIYTTTDYRDTIATNIDFNSAANNEEYFEKGATTKYTFRLAEDGSYYFESKVTN